MRKLIKLLALSFALSLFMGMSSMAAPADIFPTENTVCVDDEKYGWSSEKVEESKEFALVAPSANVNEIKIRPRYTVPGKDEIYLGSGYYVRQPFGGWPQSLLMKVTPTMKKNMDEAVAAQGGTLIGYRYDIKCRFTGDYTAGRVVIEEPAGFETTFVNDFQSYTFTVRTPVSSPRLEFSGAFYYVYQSKNLSQSIGAYSLFE